MITVNQLTYDAESTDVASRVNISTTVPEQITVRLGDEDDGFIEGDFIEFVNDGPAPIKFDIKGFTSTITIDQEVREAILQPLQRAVAYYRGPNEYQWDIVTHEGVDQDAVFMFQVGVPMAGHIHTAKMSVRQARELIHSTSSNPVPTAALTSGTYSLTGSTPRRNGYCPAIGYVIGKGGFSGQSLAYSFDGVSGWTNDTSGSTYGGSRDLATSSTLVVMTTESPTSQLWRYTSSSAATLVSTGLASSLGPVVWSEDAGQFVVFEISGTGFATSPTAAAGTWTTGSLPGTVPTYKWDVTAAPNGYYLSCATSSAYLSAQAEIWFSDNLTTWSQITVAGTRPGFWRDGASGAGVTVLGSYIEDASGQAQLLTINSAGIATVTTLPAPSSASAGKNAYVQFGNGMFVAVVSVPSAVSTSGETAQNFIYGSQDGYSWNLLSTTPDSPAVDLVFGNGIFLTCPNTTSGAQGNNKIYSITVEAAQQPSVVLKSYPNSNPGDPLHVHELTVIFDYVNHKFLVTGISNNSNDNHEAFVIGDGSGSIAGASALSELTDVSLMYPPVEGEVLAFNQTSNFWEARPLPPQQSSFKPRPLENVTLSGAYSFGSSAHHNGSYRVISAVDVTVTVQPDSFWTGTEEWFENGNFPTNPGPMPDGGSALFGKHGAGNVIFTAGSGVTINTPDTLIINRLHGKVTLIKVGPNTWDIEGNLASA